jgi:hypothetical protein
MPAGAPLREQIVQSGIAAFVPGLLNMIPHEAPAGVKPAARDRVTLSQIVIWTPITLRNCASQAG